ncbi:HNH endonuclease [Hymenobacter algoricola]|uniref:HNH endonuclease n=1 Tax=Hymenobacter algoricola TaxID=486267 RepID=UPI003CD07240
MPCLDWCWLAAEWDGILTKNSLYTSSNGLKNRLLQSDRKTAQCERCNLQHWQGAPVPLELHHLNGVNNDHRIDNLQLLCPNCHAQTSTYRGKNQLRHSARVV